MAEAQTLVGCEAKGYKDRNARESALRNLAELFEIILNYSTWPNFHPNSSSVSFSSCVFPC